MNGRSESREKHNCAAISEITEIHNNALFRRLQRLVTIWNQFTVEVDGAPGGGTLGFSGWGCAAGTLEPLTCNRASSAEFCYPILE